jgi:two-component system response regulator AtoC
MPPRDEATTARGAPASTRNPERSLVLYHRDGSKVVPLPLGATIVVGRAWPADVVVDDRSLSRQHARFTSGAEGVAFEDVGSTNGTWVAGKRVEAGRLAPGESVRLGDVTASLHVVAGAASALGLVANDRFALLLDDELRRAATFGRPVALLLVRADAGPNAHVSRWAPTVASLLRPVDRPGLYADDTMTIALPELGRADAVSLARSLVERVAALRVGVAVLPEDGATVDEAVEAVREALAATRSGARVGERPSTRERAAAAPALVAASAGMRSVLQEARRVAASTLPVLIRGETGTGKELVATALHEGSPRRGQPLHCVNCAAIPATLLEATVFGHERGAYTGADRAGRGVFELAHKGTVLLDEVGELSPAAQAALLRVLETKRVMRIGGEREIEVDVRVLAATHRDLDAMCAAGTFRQDLLYRLNAMTLVLPPLRERPEDIAPLVEAFVAEANRANGRAVRGVDEAAWTALRRWTWPGNVRELRNVVERAVVVARGDLVTVDDLPERLRDIAPRPTLEPPEAEREPGGEDAGLDFKERVRQRTRAFETDLILEALRRSGGNQTEAARALQMPVRTLAHKMQELGIKKKYDG